MEYSAMGIKRCNPAGSGNRCIVSGKTSRLYKKLVYEDQTASSAYAYIDPMEIAGNMYVEATVKQGKIC